MDNATVPAGGSGGPEEVRAQGDPHPVYGRARGRVFVALNGDVDNHLDLHAAYDAGLIHGPNMIVSGAGAYGKIGRAHV